MQARASGQIASVGFYMGTVWLTRASRLGLSVRPLARLPPNQSWRHLRRPVTKQMLPSQLPDAERKELVKRDFAQIRFWKPNLSLRCPRDSYASSFSDAVE